MNRLQYHLKYIRYQLGKVLRIGNRDYRVRGYFPNRISDDRVHELHVAAALERAMQRRPGTILDVGVNVGQTLMKVLTIDPTRRYLGIEPQPACAYFTQQFLADNEIDNANVICAALSDRDGILEFFSLGAYDEQASTVELSIAGQTQGMRRSYVVARRGDDLLKEVGIADLAIIKVDVEGAEMSVFEGLSQSIAQFRPVCLFEVLPNYTGVERTLRDSASSAANRAAAGKIKAFFHSRDYDIFQVDHVGAEKKIAAFDLDDPATFVSSDYIAYPKAA